MSKLAINITFTRSGRKDHTGRQWFKAYQNGERIMYRGRHVSYFARDEEHATKLHELISKETK